MVATTYYSFVFHNHYDGVTTSNYTINNQSTQFLMAMRGFGMPKVEIPVARSPYTDGAALVGTPFTAWPPPWSIDLPAITPYTTPREMEIAILIKAATVSALDTAYVTLLQGLTPYAPAAQGDTSSLTITLPDGSTTRQIECFCTGVSDMEMKGRTNAIVTMSFYAANPFFHQAWGWWTAWATATNPKTVTNVGHVTYWPVIKIFGDAASNITGLHITNVTTGKIWSTSQTLATGATNYITAYMDRAKMNYYNGATHADIIATLDTDAEFWPLLLGANSLQWSTTLGTPSSITVDHVWYFLGI